MSSDLVVDANVLVNALTDDGDHGTAARAALRDSMVAGPEHLRIETYRLLSKTGVTQRQIADMTGQSQSEVSEILRGCQVTSYDVLVRVCEGLDIPRGWMSLGYTDGADELADYAGRNNAEELDEDVIRPTPPRTWLNRSPWTDDHR